MENRQLVYNAILTPDGTKLVSYFTHDYQTYIDSLTGKQYMVDGGLEYVRCSANGDEISLATYLDDDFEKVREVAYRTGYGKTGKGKFQVTHLNKMSDEYLQASIDYVQDKNDKFLSLYLQEHQYRKDNYIKISEEEQVSIILE